jgi:hypothetical protein
MYYLIERIKSYTIQTRIGNITDKKGFIQGLRLAKKTALQESHTV